MGGLYSFTGEGICVDDQLVQILETKTKNKIMNAPVLDKFLDYYDMISNQ